MPLALDEGDIQIIKTYVRVCSFELLVFEEKIVWAKFGKFYFQGSGPYAKLIKKIEDDIQEHVKKVNDLAGIKESDTGLSVPSLWDLPADKQALQSEEPLQVSMKAICLQELGISKSFV